MASGWQVRTVERRQLETPSRLSLEDDDQDNYFSADMDFLNRSTVSSTRSLFGSNYEHDEQPRPAQVQFPAIYELFVGNLAMDVSEGNLELTLNEVLSRNSCVKIEELIRPRAGRPFAFVRCNTETAYKELLSRDEHATPVVSNIKTIIPKLTSCRFSKS